MGLFDRLKRLARAEISEMKRVLSDGEASDARARAGGRAEDPEEARRRAIREAEDELARTHPLDRDEYDEPVDAPLSDLEAGAALWRDTGRETEPSPPRHEHRTHAFSREVRDAYAALELPLGAQRAEIDRAFRDMLHRYHPDKHANDPRRQALAHDLTIRIREARDVLVTWLERA